MCNFLRVSTLLSKREVYKSECFQFSCGFTVLLVIVPPSGNVHARLFGSASSVITEPHRGQAQCNVKLFSAFRNTICYTYMLLQADVSLTIRCTTSSSRHFISYEGFQMYLISDNKIITFQRAITANKQILGKVPEE